MWRREQIGKLMRSVLALWLALTPLTALGQTAPQTAGTSVQIVITTSDVTVGQWTTVRLENAPPGHEGYFTAAAPLDYAERDGRPRAYPYRVTVDAEGRAWAQVRARAAGHWQVMFEDMSSGQTLPALALLHVYADAVPSAPTANIGWAYIYATTYPPGRYLKGVTANNRITVNYDLYSASGKVLLLRNNQVVGAAEVSGAGAHTFTVNMGSDTNNFINELRAVVEVDGRRSELSKEFFFTQLPGGGLFDGLTFVRPFRIEGQGADTRYVAEAEYPLDGLLYSSPGFISTDVAKLTQHDTRLRGALTLPVRCNDSGRLVSLSGAASYAVKTQVWVVPLSGGFNAGGDLTMRNPDCSVVAFELKGLIHANANLTGAKNWELKDFYKDVLGDYFPTLAALLRLTSYGTVGFQSTLGVVAEADATLKPSAPYFQSKLGLEAGLDIKGKLDHWIFPISWLTADLTQTGGRFLFNSDVRSSQFKELYSSASYGYHVNIWWGCIWGLCKPSTWDFGGGCAYTPSSGNRCAVDKGAVAAASAEAVRTTALFHAGAGWGAAALTSLTPVTATLISQVYPLSQVALAAAPGSDRVLAVWDHDDPAHPWRQSAELQSSLWDGAGWRAPITLTANTLQDFAPQVAWTNSGSAVAIWQQVAASIAPGDPPPTVTQAIEIVAAEYDAVADAWSAPTPLTANTAVDAGVQLARNDAGHLLAAWLQSDEPIAPEQPGHGAIKAAFYNGAWNAATTAVAAIDPTAELAVGYGTDTAVIAYTQMITPAGASAPVAQIFVTTWDGSAWSAPQPLAPGIHGQRSPNVSFNALAQPVVVWLEDGGVYLRNLTTGGSAVLSLDADHGAPDMLRVVDDGAGNLAAVWRSQNESFDLHVAWYALAHGLWSAPRRITDDTAWERLPAAVLNNDHQLRLAYLATGYDAYPGTLTLPDGAVVSAPVSAPGLTDLRVLGYTFDRNLTLPADALQIDNPLPAPGETVTLSATVHNTGDLPLEDVDVSFYDGNPALGGVLIATTPAPGVLAAGAVLTLSTNFVVPANSGIRTFFVVADAADLIVEQDESDNQAALRAFGPDLAFAAAEVLPDWGSVIKLRAYVVNQGTRASWPATLALFQDGAADVVATLAIPALAPGESHHFALPWDHGLLTAGLHNVEVIVNADDFDEVERANNRVDLLMPVGADLALSAFNIEIGDINLVQIPVTVTVVNAGATASADATLALHNASTRDAVATLITYTLPSLEAGEAVAVKLTVPGPLLCGVYASIAAPEGDIDPLNNYAAVADVADCNMRVFLPQVWR